MTEDNEQIRLRRAKLEQLRAAGNAYPNTFRPDSLAGELHERYGETGREALEERDIRVALGGRLVTRRIMGKASFAHLRDGSGQIQIFVQRDSLPDGVYNELFKKTLDLGDIVGVSGKLFRTKTDELTVAVDHIELATKAVRPLPEKFHGLTDAETRYRQRYVDLIVTGKTRDIFRTRARVLFFLRDYLNRRGYLEIESPMMLSIPGGAAARPFVTHHNALGMDLYLRVAQELYIKRVMVGGFEKVYELNRVFRNEGVSTRHNPEFTMLEYNEAWVDFNEYMDLTEDMLRSLVVEIHHTTGISYQGEALDFGPPFRRLAMRDAIVEYGGGISAEDLEDHGACARIAGELGARVEAGDGRGKLWLDIFEHCAEQNLVQPTFITGYPAEVSPLSRPSEEDSFLTDRFELFIAGREIANGFSEVNDPDYQADRFRAQVALKEAGDFEAMHFDADYIRALEYGLPPNAGGGIGIDRLVMLLTDSASIRDVLLFPYMRPEA